MSKRANEHIKVYGINNCDTVQKAIKYLNTHHIEFEFHDYKKLGIDAKKLKSWAKLAPLDQIVNKKSSTYRLLSEEDKEKLNQLDTALPIIQANSSIIKRPIIELKNNIILGFDEKVYKNQL